MNYIGKIVNTKGLNGEVKILSSSDFKEERFKVGKKIFIKDNGQTIEFTIQKSYSYKNFEIIKFENINNINDVLKYKGQKIYSEELGRDVLEEGEYFFSDLDGLEVYEQEIKIGKVVEVLDYGNKTYLRIKKVDNVKVLFPFALEFIEKIDLENAIIYIKPIEGLLDDQN